MLKVAIALGIIIVILLLGSYLIKGAFNENNLITGLTVKETDNRNEEPKNNQITGNVINLRSDNIDKAEEETGQPNPDTNPMVPSQSGPNGKINVSVQVIG
mgnify:CR=1 FL=1